MQLPSWLTWYKKPSYVDVNEFANRIREKAEKVHERSRSMTSTSSPLRRSSSESSRRSCEVPTKLSLDRILRNKPCSPMSLYDFYMYLKYIEHSSENLEFYVWFKNYENGRLTAFPDLPRAVTPLDGKSFTDSEKSLAKPGNEEKFSSESSVSDDPEAQDNSDFENAELFARIAAFCSPANGCGTASPLYNRPWSFAEKARAAEEADPDKPVNKLEIARRAEIETIKKLFLLPGSPKELNIPSPMRRKVLDAITLSTDPKIFAPIAEHCHLLLKSCSHRNFIRLGVSNGTFETICVATTLGIVLTIGGIMAMLLLAFVSPGFRQCSRWRGIGIWPMWSVGLGLILSGLRGSCFFLLLFSRRQPLPWERFEEDNSQATKKKNKFIRLVSRLMIFDRKLKVKDDNLRRLQHKVVFQSLLGGAVFATMAVVVFLCLPIWKEI
ncbi:hypothetical protein N431DRAFT_374315 [Stipitochalara longipes BDJ]|nr:hypothetical protein N431DRAFT_374315 [Stipitochalara longipes BDJ]